MVMTAPLLSSFAEPATHAVITQVIRQLSSNRSDVREIALQDVDLSAVRDILELGCGFGFMSEPILDRAEPGARLIGVDACEENRDPFLRTTERRGRPVEFHCLRLATELPWPSGSFDLVVAFYSLYYFPSLVGEIARVLRPAGLFLTIAHRQNSFRALFNLAGVKEDGTPLSALMLGFSAENGQAKLLEFFGRVQKIDYPNRLCFDRRHRSELLEYVRFKLPLLKPDANPAAEPPWDLERRVTDALNRSGEFVIDKTDAVFRCWEPKVS